MKEFSDCSAAVFSLQIFFRSYTAATLSSTEPDYENEKNKALAAATTELERLFRKEDFGRMKVANCCYI